MSEPKKPLPELRKTLRQDWAGGLSAYKEQYTSVELQHKALEWRSGITLKDKITTRLRQLITCSIPFAHETDHAEALLCALSYQSTLMPERHVWIDTDLDGIGIDLEDRQIDDEWDNAVARVKVLSLEDALDVTRVWLCGQNLSDWYSNVNKQYGFVNKKIALPALLTA